MPHLPNTRKNMHSKLLPPMILLLLALCGCSGSGLMYYLHNPDDPQTRQSVKKMICINPVFSTEKGKKKSATEAVEMYEAKNRRFQELLLDNAGKARVNLQLIDGNHLKSSDQDYFNDLAPLFNQMLIAVNLQGDSYETRYVRKSEVEGSWEWSPLVDSRFSFLSKKYGTPYFMFARLLQKESRNVRTVWQAIVVNVEAGTIRRAEYRITGIGPSMDYLDSMMYDFFNTIYRADR
jgi:hypothetical protein